MNRLSSDQTLPAASAGSVRPGKMPLQSVEAYLDAILDCGYPKGKLTLNHGWGIFPDGTIESGYGSWHPDPKTFPDFQRTLDMLREKGFTPGLWIGFPKVHHASTIARRYPDMLGAWSVGGNVDKATAERWLNPKADIFSYGAEVIDSRRCVEAVGEYLWGYDSGPKRVLSDFYAPATGTDRSERARAEERDWHDAARLAERRRQ